MQTALALAWLSPLACFRAEDPGQPPGNACTLKRTDRSMAVDHIRYDILAQEALRGVVRTVLVDAAKNGLPGDHHFYISFDTRADGVRLSPRMLAQYPKEMTLVLQHQFWDLVVTEDGFEVGVSFSGIPERLAIPFAAIKGFFEPSVQFGLQFQEIGETGPDTQEGA